MDEHEEPGDALRELEEIEKMLDSGGNVSFGWKIGEVLITILVIGGIVLGAVWMFAALGA